VVDDDATSLFTLTSVLDHQHVEVTHADGGDAALARLEAGLAVDCILMDITMPNMDGYEATRRIRKIHGLEAVPIVAFTGKVLAGDRERCLAAGATDYIAKPVDLVQLLSILRIQMAGFDSGRAAASEVKD
jgi:CheY-like chemotaxis protein